MEPFRELLKTKTVALELEPTVRFLGVEPLLMVQRQQHTKQRVWLLGRVVTLKFEPVLMERFQEVIAMKIVVLVQLHLVRSLGEERLRMDLQLRRTLQKVTKAVLGKREVVPMERFQETLRINRVLL
jgi:hypothetical protein